MIQLLALDSGMPNSFLHDHERHGLPTEHVLEMVNCSAEQLAECISTVFTAGFATARRQYHERISLTNSYLYALGQILSQRRDGAALDFVRRTLRRDGFDAAFALRAAFLYLRVVGGRMARALGLQVRS